MEILFFSFPQTQPTTTTRTIATQCYVKIFMVILVTKFSLSQKRQTRICFIFFYFHFHIVTWAYVQPPNTQRWHKNLSRILSERTAFFHIKHFLTLLKFSSWNFSLLWNFWFSKNKFSNAEKNFHFWIFKARKLKWRNFVFRIKETWNFPSVTWQRYNKLHATCDTKNHVFQCAKHNKNFFTQYKKV